MKILKGNSLYTLKDLADKSVHLVVTSPPYFSLRHYGTQPQIWDARFGCKHKWKWTTKKPTSGPSGESPDSRSILRNKSATKLEKHYAFCEHCEAWQGELGQEPTPALYLQHLMQIIAQVYRVMRDDGVFFLNIDDSYSASGHGGGGGSISEKGDHLEKVGGYKGRKAPNCWNLKPKDMCLIPERLAIACQEMGFYVRRRIIWHKPNPMPESTTDRPSRAHEIIWMLTKSERYYFDAHAIKEPVKTGYLERALRGRSDNHKQVQGSPGQTPHSILKPKKNGELDKSFSALANKKDVWTINVSSFKDAHFATFPRELPRLCILAGTSAYGCCASCGAPYERMLEKGEADKEAQRACGGDLLGEYKGQATKEFAGTGAQNASEVKSRILEGMRVKKTIGWQSTCKCEGKNFRAADSPRPDYIKPCIVLDPFSGSGTTGEVAQELGRDFIGSEVGEQYHGMIETRTAQAGLALA